MPVAPKRRRGRPVTGRVPIVTLRLPQDMIEALNRTADEEGVSRSEVVRRMIEKAMGREPPTSGGGSPER
jgi:metal-responsive CopG/Arc/MetJ family transcriptional regulator